jgi:hypothetical protein
MSFYVRSSHDRLCNQTQGPGDLPAKFKFYDALINMAGAIAVKAESEANYLERVPAISQRHLVP